LITGGDAGATHLEDSSSESEVPASVSEADEEEKPSGSDKKAPSMSIFLNKYCPAL